MFFKLIIHRNIIGHENQIITVEGEDTFKCMILVVLIKQETIQK